MKTRVPIFIVLAGFVAAIGMSVELTEDELCQ